VANHLSWIDILLLCAVFRCPSFVAKAAVAQVPIVGFLCQVVGVVFVEARHHSDEAAAAAAAAAASATASVGALTTHHTHRRRSAADQMPAVQEGTSTSYSSSSSSSTLHQPFAPTTASHSLNAAAPTTAAVRPRFSSFGSSHHDRSATSEISAYQDRYRAHLHRSSSLSAAAGSPPPMPSLAIFPEGSTSNGTHLCKAQPATFCVCMQSCTVDCDYVCCRLCAAAGCCLCWYVCRLLPSRCIRSRLSGATDRTALPLDQLLTHLVLRSLSLCNAALLHTALC
jgi:hypothetical protein